MAEFFDAFIIGDAEEAFTEISKYIGECKRKNVLNDDILKGLLSFDGVYVPGFYKQKYNTAGDVVWRKAPHPPLLIKNGTGL